MTNPILDKIVEDCGSLSELARRLDVKPQSVYTWRKRGFVPSARALQLEVMFGVSAKDLVNPRLREISELLVG